METFRFRLSTLLRMRQNLRDECRQQLSAVQRAEEIIQTRITQLAHELSDLRQQSAIAGRPGRINVDRLLDAGRYEMMLKAEMQAAEEQRQAVAAEVERRRQSLVEADREVKMLEKLREKQASRHRSEQHRNDMKQLDDLAIQTARVMEVA